MLTPQIKKTYILGLLHDATERKTTFRVATKSKEFADFIKTQINYLGGGAWIYKEGKDRNLWIVEFSKSFLKNVSVKTKQDRIEYIRGYFDTEGGISKSSKVRYYLYFCQKDKSDLIQVRNYLEELNIRCGIIHNPSRMVDPNYWRFFVSVKSYEDFAKIVGSNHPDKKIYLRMKI